jgi:hypothetical protein
LQGPIKQRRYKSRIEFSISISAYLSRIKDELNYNLLQPHLPENSQKPLGSKNCRELSCQKAQISHTKKTKKKTKTNPSKIPQKADPQLTTKTKTKIKVLKVHRKRMLTGFPLYYLTTPNREPIIRIRKR